ncbi:MAG: R3H domain-containing nucleic acid-binding protein [Dehalococcoidia bacterium]
MAHRWIVDDLEALLVTLPSYIQKPLRQRKNLRDLLEVVMDLGRPAEARFPGEDVVLDSREVTEEDLQYVVSRIGDFGGDNRAGIERTLHRISCIKNRKGKVVGLTCRVGRAVFGTMKVVEDLVLSGKNLLLLGRPGVGKTTMLREVSRVLADDAKKRVIIVDTSNEIAGDGDIPHPAIGHARRMQVPTPALQHAVMIEAVENHMPEVIVIDEMGTELEAAAARTIAERGVQLVATAHGNTLDNLIMNPTLSDLVGGVQAVTLGDEEARRRGTQKTVLERKAPPTFDIVVEIQDWERVAIHDEVTQVVDAWLRGHPLTAEVRWVEQDGRVARSRQVTSAPPGVATLVGESQEALPSTGTTSPRVFLFGISRQKVSETSRRSGITVELANDLQEADLLLTTRLHYRRNAQAVRTAEELGKPVYVLRKNSPPQIQQFLRSLTKREGGADTFQTALSEAQQAAERVLGGEQSLVDLTPQQAYIRRLQHLIAERYNLGSTSVGEEPHRHVAIFRP